MNIDSFSDRLICCLVNSNLAGSFIDKLYCNNIFTRYGNARDGKRKVYCLGAAAEAVLFATSAVSGEVLRAFAVTVFSIAPVIATL